MRGVVHVEHESSGNPSSIRRDSTGGARIVGKSERFDTRKKGEGLKISGHRLIASLLFVTAGRELEAERQALQLRRPELVNFLLIGGARSDTCCSNLGQEFGT